MTTDRRVWGVGVWARLSGRSAASSLGAHGYSTVVGVNCGVVGGVIGVVLVAGNIGLGVVF